MRFDSKKDLWLGLLIWISIGGGLIASIMSKAWFAIILMLGTAGFIGWIWFGTRYYISGENLIVKCGPFSERILIKDIKSIKKHVIRFHLQHFLLIGLK
ncbi:PH domain-containing protein [Natronincola peptidivorans]|uniref:PH domain-containing protein n=1 Tax=Natronincola peptidivorans TaxID=426128 RepID=A0A1I0FLX8_9FIRM|nr:PH domain-containing protein [Natronincola peptidivorans]SET59314.1 PH domain-containing protein [Natronincola peptidivorans]